MRPYYVAIDALEKKERTTVGSDRHACFDRMPLIIIYFD
jgi:hypothetical protein